MISKSALKYGGLIVLLLMLSPWVSIAAEGMIFDFESGIFPNDSLQGGNAWLQPADVGVQIESDQVDKSRGNVCTNDNENRGGVVLRSKQIDNAILRDAWSTLTVCLLFRASPVSTTPVFFERLSAASSDHVGFFRFSNQSNSGDDHIRKGTLRINARKETGEVVSAISTLPWVQMDSTWHWVAFVFDAGKVRFLVDGEPLGEPIDLQLNQIPAVKDEKYLLRSGFGFRGGFDDLLILPGRALTDDQLKTIYKKGIQSAEGKAILK